MDATDTTVIATDQTPVATDGKTREARLKAKREYMRAKRAADRAAKEALVKDAEAPVADAVADVVEPVAEPVAPVAPAEPAPLSAQHIKMLEDQLSAMARGIADTWIILSDMPAGAPTLADDKARMIAEAWASKLAPFIDPRSTDWLGWTMASVTTATVGFSYYRDVNEWRAKQPKTKPSV